MGSEVLHPGRASVLQDNGRYGFQHSGVPVCGAMDRYSHRLANLLVGNQQDTATLEMTLRGPTLRFTQQTLIALCGADLSPQLDGQPLAMQQAIRVSAGSVLTFGRPQYGVRTYLAAAGGFHIPAVMGSQSTCLAAAFGGVAGRYLQQGDYLLISRSFRQAQRLVLPFGAADIFTTQDPIRIIRGRHWAQFSPAAHQHLLQDSWQIAAESNRMGYRLQGKALTRESSADIYSEAVDFGTIQVPADGQPIVLMADSQTTGGYPKIAHVASVDLPRLAQMMPGTHIRFSLISVEQAQQLAMDREKWFQALV